MRANPLLWLAVGFVTVWRKLISPAYGQVCRFHPSCSAYSLEALRRFGFVRGSYLTIRRLLRCHPWNPGGYDPVPRVMTWRRRHDEPGPDVDGNPEAVEAAGARSTTSR
jgi:putative membrane protein insertion efficiency factor